MVESYFDRIYLETPRLIIREMLLADTTPLWIFGQDARHRQYEPDAPRTHLEFEDIVQWILSTQLETPRLFHYVAVVRKDQPEQPIGSVHISIRDIQHRQAEVGYTFDVAVWGQGYCTEAARAMVEFAFTTLHMHRVFAADIIAENTASIRVAQKLGMRHEATFREALNFNGRWWHTQTYGILEEEWRMHNGQA